MIFHSFQSRLSQLASQNTGARPRYLFRGESQNYGCVNPTLSRILKSDRELAMASLAVCQEARRIKSAFTGYAPRGFLDLLALLQHYRWWTPLLDLTGSPEIALWFAFDHWKPDQTDMAVIYVVDTANMTWAQNGNLPIGQMEGPVIVDHDFLLTSLSEGGQRVRWLRQDGYAITTSNCLEPQCIERFDLLKSSNCEKLQFRFPTDYKRTLGDLYEESGDPLPAAVQGCLRILLDALGWDRFSPRIRQEFERRLNDIYTGPSASGANSIKDLSRLILKPARWAHLAFLVWFVRLLAGVVAERYSSKWRDQEAKPVLRAIEYSAAACRSAQIQPKGFSFVDIQNVAAVSMPPQGALLSDPTSEEIISLLSRAAYRLASASQAYDYNAGAHCVTIACLADCISLFNDLNLGIESEILSNFEKAWTKSHHDHWNDGIQIDPNLLLNVPPAYLKLQNEIIIP